MLIELAGGYRIRVDRDVDAEADWSSATIRRVCRVRPDNDPSATQSLLRLILRFLRT
jgi:hypothetical protein